MRLRRCRSSVGVDPQCHADGNAGGQHSNHQDQTQNPDLPTPLLQLPLGCRLFDDSLAFQAGQAVAVRGRYQVGYGHRRSFVVVQLCATPRFQGCIVITVTSVPPFPSVGPRDGNAPG